MKTSILKITESSILVNVINFALTVLVWGLIFNATVGYVWLALLPIMGCLNALVNKGNYYAGHLCRADELDSILANGFNEGLAEKNLTRNEASLYTQQGNTNNVCFSVTSMTPVIKMRAVKDGAVPMATIYFKLNANGNLRISTLSSSSEPPSMAKPRTVRGTASASSINIENIPYTCC